MTSIRTESLNPFGIEAIDCDLAGEMSDSEIAALRKLWLQHGVMLFRNQQLNESSLVRFSRYFGSLEIHVREEYLSAENPEILLVSNVKENDKSVGILGDHEVGWHHDQIYLARPALGSVLCAVILPPSGGNTAFVNLADAYDALSKDMKQRLQGLRAVHSYAYFNGQWSEPTSSAQRERTPDVDHPLVRTHPETGRQAIYADPGMTVSIVGLQQTESRELLEELFEHCLQPQFLYEHVWNKGDVLMWDNASTMHRRGEFDPTSERLMKRTTILPPTEFAVPV